MSIAAFSKQDYSVRAVSRHDAGKAKFGARHVLVITWDLNFVYSALWAIHQP